MFAHLAHLDSQFLRFMFEALSELEVRRVLVLLRKRFIVEQWNLGLRIAEGKKHA